MIYKIQKQNNIETTSDLETSPHKDKILEDVFEKTVEELNIFFDMNWEKDLPLIYLVKDRNTINTIMGKETKNYVVGFIDDKKNIYLLDKENYETESCHKYSDNNYFKLLKHELAHSFMDRYTDNKRIKPKWISEGIPVYLSGQNENENFKKLSGFISFYSNDGKQFNSYTESGFAIEFLITQYGKEKLLSFLQELKKDDSESNLNKTFKKIYGVELDYKNFF